MSVNISFWEYLINIATGITVLLAFSIISLVWGIKYAVKRKTKGFISSICSALLSVILLCCFHAHDVPVLLNILRDCDTPQTTVSGIITDIEEESMPVLFEPRAASESPSRVHACYVEIDNEQYYILYIGRFHVGESVKITYLPNSKAVIQMIGVDNDDA